MLDTLDTHLNAIALSLCPLLGTAGYYEAIRWDGRFLIHSRGYRREDDLLQLHRLLLDTFELNQTMHNWWIERFESGLYFLPEDWTAGLGLWFDDATLVGAAHPRSGVPQEAHIQIHPHYRNLEAEMVTWIEETMRQHAQEDDATISFWVYEYDVLRQRLLEARGYEPTDHYRYERWRSLVPPIPDMPLPDGYHVRALDRDDDAERMAHALNAAFNRTLHTSAYYRKVQTAPSYRRDLDLAAIARDDSIAAFATAWYHPMNRIGAFEPVGTHPHHRRKGLAKRVVTEGMRRLQMLGATRVNIGTGMNPVANRFYASLGFTDYQKSVEWIKRVT